MVSPFVRFPFVLAAGWFCSLAFGQDPVGPVPGPASPTDLLVNGPGGPVGGGEAEAERDRIETDRDSFTPATRVVGRGRLVVESAYSYTAARDGTRQHSFPELLLRYGLSERFEFRLGWNYEIGGVDVSGLGRPTGSTALDETERGNHLAYGFKFGLTEQDGFRPESVLIVQGSTPTGGADTVTRFTGTYAFGWTFLRDWKWDSAVRYGTGSEEHDRFGIWSGSTVLKVPVGDRWTTHVEYFNLATVGKEVGFMKHFISPGAHFLLTPDLEIGVRVGWGMNDQAARFFANAGLGVRF